SDFEEFSLDDIEQ
nr:Chain I, HIRULLIN [Hirudinaria manillensis]